MNDSATKTRFKRHPVWTGVIALLLLAAIFGGDKKNDNTAATTVESGGTNEQKPEPTKEEKEQKVYETRQSDMKYVCTETIKGMLKAPSTAKFPSITEWSFQKTGSLVNVVAYVDSQNSFGAMLRSNIRCQYSMSGDKIDIVDAKVLE